MNAPEPKLNLPIIEVPEPKPFEMTRQQAVIAELANLSALDYETRREAAAKDLGFRVPVLDTAVADARPADTAAQDADDVIEVLEPWPEPVDGAALANTIHATMCQHMTFADPADPVAATVWLFGTYLMDVWRLWPKILISSPAKRCGKSTFCEILEAHAHRPLVVANCTTAALFRTIETFSPTFILDEADTFLRENPDIGGLLNAGHTRRTAYAIRLVGDNHEAKKFSVWCAQIIAGIGEQTDTLADRSIRINLKRQLPTERKVRVPADMFEQFSHVRRKLLRWAKDNSITIAATDADPGECGNDRARDNWATLTRIALVLGDVWPERIRAAYAAKEAQHEGAIEDDAALMLLADMHGYFTHHPHAERVTSANIVEYLIGLDDRPWATWGKGAYPITKAAIARKVKAFEVQPRVARDGQATARSYAKRDIEDAFTRYITPSSAQPAPQSVTVKQIRKNKTLEETKSVTCSGALHIDNTRNHLEDNDCYGVTLSAPLSGEDGGGNDPDDDFSAGGF